MATKEEIIEFMISEFPQASIEIVDVGGQASRVRLDVNESHLRPGGTVSGPTIMAVADVALYVAIFGEIGITPLAVTTNLNINFMRKPVAHSAIVGVCKMLKVGKVLAVGEVSIYSEGNDEVVAHVTGTYSIPPNNLNAEKK